MALKCGIVGLPNVGKSTLFNCISSSRAQAANFPFCTIEPNVGSTTVPDDRLGVLTDICHPKRTIPATVEIVDIAGLVKGASRGEGLGNQFLANIRETDAILHVLRCFDDPNVTHVDGSVDPVRDKEIIDVELQIKDLETVENRLSKLQKQAQTGGDKQAKKAVDVLLRYKEVLEQGRNAREVELDNAEERKIAREFCLLTNKPVLYVCNVDEASAASGNAYVDAVRAAVAGEDAQLLVISAKIESEIAELDDPGRVPCLDHPPGRQSPAGGRRDPYRFRKRLHPGRSHQVRRFRGTPQRSGLPGGGQTCQRRQGVRGAGWRHHALPVQCIILQDSTI